MTNALLAISSPQFKAKKEGSSSELQTLIPRITERRVRKALRFIYCFIKIVFTL
jgi:hypothetical protein